MCIEYEKVVAPCRWRLADYGGVLRRNGSRRARGTPRYRRRGTARRGQRASLEREPDALALVALLLDHGADVNASNETRITALMTAAENASPPVIALLLDRGADARAGDDRGWTALHYAVTSSEVAGETDYVRALLAGGAPPNFASLSGSTPLWIAAQVSAPLFACLRVWQ